MRTDTGVVVEGQGRGGGETPKAVKLTRSWPAQGGAQSIWAQGSPAGGPYVSCDSPQILHGPGPRMERVSPQLPTFCMWDSRARGWAQGQEEGGVTVGDPLPAQLMEEHTRHHSTEKQRERQREARGWRGGDSETGAGKDAGWSAPPWLALNPWPPSRLLLAPRGPSSGPELGTQTAVIVPRGAAGGWDI